MTPKDQLIKEIEDKIKYYQKEVSRINKEIRKAPNLNNDILIRNVVYYQIRKKELNKAISTIKEFLKGYKLVKKEKG